MQFWFTSSRACGNKSIVVAVSCSYRLRIMWWLDLDRPAYKKLTITFFLAMHITHGCWNIVGMVRGKKTSLSSRLTSYCFSLILSAFWLTALVCAS